MLDGDVKTTRVPSLLHHVLPLWIHAVQTYTISMGLKNGRGKIAKLSITQRGIARLNKNIPGHQ